MWPWTAFTHFVSKFVSFKANHENLNKDRPNYPRQKCVPVIPFSGNIRFMRIFAGVDWRGGVKRQRVFSMLSLAISSQPLKLRATLLAYIATWSPSSAFRWSQNRWPWMTMNGHFTLNFVFAPARELVIFDNCLSHSKATAIGSNQATRKCIADALFQAVTERLISLITTIFSFLWCQKFNL